MKTAGNAVAIASLKISAITDAELAAAFNRVVEEHKDAVASIQRSMIEADDAYRKYLDADYEPLEDVAREDRAVLNRAEKNIAEKFSALKTAYEKPLESIEANIKAIRGAIKNASGVVDGAVKNYEEKRKALKTEEIRSYFETRKFELLPLERIFNDRWLNKGAKMKDIREQIDAAIEGIYRDIEVLERIPEHAQTAKAMYLETLDLGAALRQVDILKANAERLAREQAEREERKNREQVDRNAAAERREEQAAAKEVRVQNLVDQALDLPAGTTEDRTMPDIMEYTLRFRGTEEQLLKLREYMTANGIAYEKGYVFERVIDVREYQRRHGLDSPVFSIIFDAA